MKNLQKELLNILENKGFTPLEKAISTKRRGQTAIELCSLAGFTKFELAVYKAVLKIPRGETRTYSQIAAQIKHPKAVRAVGSALNKNPFTVVIPCHRVIKKDGGLGGYSGGVKLKEKLLEMEKEKTRHRPA